MMPRFFIGGKLLGDRTTAFAQNSVNALLYDVA
jgi:hypothetical protein